MVRTFLVQIGIVIFSTLACTVAFADVGPTFGLDARSLALSNSQSTGLNPSLTYLQPAYLSYALRNSAPTVLTSYSVIAADLNFKPVQDVLIQNDLTSDQLQIGNTDTDYKAVLAQSVGIAFGTLPSFAHLAFGISASTPMQQTLAFDTGESYQPEYLLYRSRLQRPQVDFAASACPFTQWCVGLGSHLGYGVTANANVFLQTNRSKPSSARFATTLKPRMTPYGGVQFFGDTLASGLVIRAPSKSEATMRVDASARAFGSLAALDLSYVAQSMLFYDPWSFEWGNDLKISDENRLSLKLIYQLWKSYRPPTLLIEDPATSQCSGGCSGIQISPSDAGFSEFQNTISPRIGFEHALSSEWVSRMGYGYQPSILKDSTPDGTKNYLDPSRHLFSVGIGMEHPFRSSIVTADFGFFYHHLKNERVSKQTVTDIGYPGYDTGGHIIGGGITLGLRL